MFPFYSPLRHMITTTNRKISNNMTPPPSFSYRSDIWGRKNNYRWFVKNVTCINPVSYKVSNYPHLISRFNCWFGTIGILDKLHKTDKPFCGSVQEVRHYVSFSLTPVKEIHPDPADRLANTSCTKVE